MYRTLYDLIIVEVLRNDMFVLVLWRTTEQLFQVQLDVFWNCDGHICGVVVERNGHVDTVCSVCTQRLEAWRTDCRIEV